MAPLFVLTLSLLDLPLDAYQQSISLQYGLSVQGWGSWFGDFLKGQLIGLIIATPALFLLIWFIRKSPRRWWFYFWLIAVPCIVFLVMIAPIVIDPMFNKFEPLEKTNPQLVEQLERVTPARRPQHSPRSYVPDESQRESHYAQCLRDRIRTVQARRGLGHDDTKMLPRRKLSLSLAMRWDITS